MQKSARIRSSFKAACLWSQPPETNNFWSLLISTQEVPGYSKGNVLTASHDACSLGVNDAINETTGTSVIYLSWCVPRPRRRLPA